MDMTEWISLHVTWHETLLSQPDTSTTVHCFHFGSASSFLLELFLYSSPVAYWALTDLGSSSFSVLSFCLFILFMGFSRQEYWSGLPSPSPMDHILSKLSTMTHRLGWPYTVWLIVSLNYAKLWWMESFLLVFCDCGFHSVCLLMDEDNRLYKLLAGRGRLLYYTEGFMDKLKVPS